MSEVQNSSGSSSSRVLGGPFVVGIESWESRIEEQLSKEQKNEQKNLPLKPSDRRDAIARRFTEEYKGNEDLTPRAFERYMPVGLSEALKKLAEQTGVKLTDPNGNERSMNAILQDVPPSQLNKWLNSLPQEVRVGVLGIIAGVYAGTTGENSELRKLLESFGLKVRVIGDGGGVTVTVAPQPGKGPQVAAQLKIKLGENGRIEISGYSNNFFRGEFGAGLFFGLKEGGLEIQSRVVGSIDPNNNHQASLTFTTWVTTPISPGTKFKFGGELKRAPGADSVGGSIEVRGRNYAIEGRVTCKEQCIGALKGIVNF
jgi:hypothetical protein